MHHFKPNQVILYHFIFTLIIVDPNKYYVDAVYPHKLPTESQNWDAFGIREGSFDCYLMNMNNPFYEFIFDVCEGNANQI